MKYVASCSCGKDSLAMVLTLIEKEYPLDYVIFVDMGKEFKSIYRAWDKLTKLLDEHNINYKKIEPVADYFDYMFSDYEFKGRDGSIKKGYSWCGGRCRWGTTIKNKLIKEFYKDTFGDELICEYVGIANDELDRVQIKRDSIKIYPLILWGMSENDCLVKCYKSGFNWLEESGVDLYDVLDRVSCYCCRNKNLKELKAIKEFLPEYWQKLKDMQAKTSIPFREDRNIFEED